MHHFYHDFEYILLIVFYLFLFYFIINYYFILELNWIELTVRGGTVNDRENSRRWEQEMTWARFQKPVSPMYKRMRYQVTSPAFLLSVILTGINNAKGLIGRTGPPSW